MSSAYVCGPITHGGEDYLPLYKRLVALCENYFDEVRGTYPDFWEVDEPPSELYQRAFETVTGCDIFIVEVTSPSHGIGMELQMAKNHDIPVIALAEQGEDISSMVKGLPNLRRIIRYSDRDELEQKLEDEIQ